MFVTVSESSVLTLFIDAQPCRPYVELGARSHGHRSESVSRVSYKESQQF